MITIPYPTAHTFIAYIWEKPPSPGSAKLYHTAFVAKNGI